MKMRIVAKNSKKVFIQENKNGDWEQIEIENCLFDEYMKNNFPIYYNEFSKNTHNENMIDFFYNYKETEKMIRKGIAYIFEQ